MKLDNNPFEYEAANNLTDEMIAKYYIDDFNYARFIQSKRNIFLVGERGSGKTMALLFNRWRIQRFLARQKGEELPISTIGIYIPCNTPLTHKTEYQLVDNFRASVLSEHFLVLSLTHSLAETLSETPEILEGANESALCKEAEFILGNNLPKECNFFEAIQQFVQRELLETQRTLNSSDRSAFYENTFSFISVFVPILNIFANKIPRLGGSHFLLLIDDAHSLNEHQIRALNSWIAYRDHSLFSFKVAVAKVGTQTKITSSGGSILEGHDYTEIDLEVPYQNKESIFYKLARPLIKRRLENFSIDAEPEDFFPVSNTMERQLEESKQIVFKEAILKFGTTKEASKSVKDYVYKYKRAHYFKNRPPKANRPPYSGFETLVFLSTGVVRNLLEPCFWMFDRMISDSNSENGEYSKSIPHIPPKIQTEIILDRSQKTWDWLRDRIAQDIEDCSTEDGLYAFRLLDLLAVHFRHRLLHHESEPCALSFTISQREPDIMEKLNHIIEILRKAQLLYIRNGPSKDDGKRETYYVPNKILWPSRGLDPHGQHARVSIPSNVLWNAAKQGQSIKVNQNDDRQQELWNNE